MTASPPQPPVSGGGADPAPSAAERVKGLMAELSDKAAEFSTPAPSAADPPMTTRLADGTLAGLELCGYSEVGPAGTDPGEVKPWYRLVPADRLSELAEGEALAAAAYPAPWDYVDEGDGRRIRGQGVYSLCWVQNWTHIPDAPPHDGRPEAELIVWLRNNFSALASRLRSLEAQRRQMEEALEGARSFTSAVAGDDCPHAPWAERELRRITAALTAPAPEEG